MGNEVGVLGLIVGMIIGFFIGMTDGYNRVNSAINTIRREAIDVGVAYYDVDLYGKTRFVWRTNVVDVSN